MSKTMKNTPKLRFPEFRDAPEWEEKTLENVCEKISDGIHSTPIYDDNGEFYFINGNNLTNSKIEINENTKKINETEYLKYKVELSSQTILLSINGTIGNLAFFNNEKIILGKSASYLNLKLNENKYFIFNLLQSSNTRKHFEKELTGSTIKNLSLTTIKNTKVFFPHPKEQQKIADCLSSVDELITAQSAKVEALKAHKKALMQQLFPAEGETTPRLRFPEFKKAPAWEEKILDEVVNRYDNLRVPISAINRIAGKTPYYGANGIQGYVSGYTHDGEFILLAEDGANDLIDYPIQYVNGKIWVNNHAHVLQAKKDIANNRFLKFAISKIKIEPFLVGGGRAKLNANIMMKLKINIPKQDEQQKIADCLCSVDELISSQSAKVEALKTHKKALMQQLFPSNDKADK